ncbi:MAG: hypothetical protein IPN54_05675 [Bacteroidetes bacterium]|nr:hypothetical protein [Bacteroidota bacterium]
MVWLFRTNIWGNTYRSMGNQKSRWNYMKLQDADDRGSMIQIYNPEYKMGLAISYYEN